MGECGLVIDSGVASSASSYRLYIGSEGKVLNVWGGDVRYIKERTDVLSTGKDLGGGGIASTCRLVRGRYVCSWASTRLAVRTSLKWMEPDYVLPASCEPTS